MSVTAVAAAGTAVALYLYGRRGAACSTLSASAERETHAGLHSAPTTLLEDLFFLAEGLRFVRVRYGRSLADSVHCGSPRRPSHSGRQRQCDNAVGAGAPVQRPKAPRRARSNRRYTYGETLGRWRTADLLIGLAYLCRKVRGGTLSSTASQQPRSRHQPLTRFTFAGMPCRSQTSTLWQTLRSWGGRLGRSWPQSSGLTRWCVASCLIVAARWPVALCAAALS